jgi:5'-nucleotidase
MRILLTNDDGVTSLGLKMLFNTLSRTHDVTVVAPARERSASSHSLTLRKRLKTRTLGRRITAVYGTPTDCVVLAIYYLLSELPDMVVSGVNLGANLGDDISYSGTVGAAFEGAFNGIPSMAISFVEEKRPDFKAMDEFVPGLIEKARNTPKDIVLNVNIPFEPKGVRITTLGKREYVDIVERRRNGYFIGGTRKESMGSGTDFKACHDGHVSVTPLRTDLTDYEAIETLKAWEF